MSISFFYQRFKVSPQQKIAAFAACGLGVLLAVHPALYPRQAVYGFIGGAYLFLWLIILYCSGRPEYPPVVLWGPAAFLLGSVCVSLLMQAAPQWSAIGLLAVQLLVCFAGWWLAADQDALRLLGHALVAAAAVVAAYGLVQFLHLDPVPLATPFKDRVVSVFTNPNHFGSFMALVLPLSLAFYLQDLTPRARRLTALAVLLIYAGLLLSGSRGAWCGGLVGVLIVAISCVLRMQRRGLADLMRPVVGLLALISIVTWGLTYKPVIQTAEKTVTIKQRALSSTNLVGAGVEQDSSINHRYFIWQVSWEMVRSAPLVGIGYGQYQQRFGQFRDQLKEQTRFSSLNPGQQQETTLYAHNEYLHWWAENGLLGLLGFLCIVVLGVVRGTSIIWQSKDYAALGWGSLGLLAALLVHSLVSYPLRLPLNSLPFWLILGSFYRKSKR